MIVHGPSRVDAIKRLTKSLKDIHITGSENQPRLPDLPLADSPVRTKPDPYHGCGAGIGIHPGGLQSEQGRNLHPVFCFQPQHSLALQVNMPETHSSFSLEGNLGTGDWSGNLLLYTRTKDTRYDMKQAGQGNNDASASATGSIRSPLRPETGRYSGSRTENMLKLRATTYFSEINLDIEGHMFTLDDLTCPTKDT